MKGCPQGGREEGCGHGSPDCRCPLHRVDGAAARPPRVRAARRRGHRRQRVPGHHTPASGVQQRDVELPAVRDHGRPSSRQRAVPGCVVTPHRRVGALRQGSVATTARADGRAMPVAQVRVRILAAAPSSAWLMTRRLSRGRRIRWQTIQRPPRRPSGVPRGGELKARSARRAPGAHQAGPVSVRVPARAWPTSAASTRYACGSGTATTAATPNATKNQLT